MLRMLTEALPPRKPSNPIIRETCGLAVLLGALDDLNDRRELKARPGVHVRPASLPDTGGGLFRVFLLRHAGCAARAPRLALSDCSRNCSNDRNENCHDGDTVHGLALSMDRYETG